VRAGAVLAVFPCIVPAEPYFVAGGRCFDIALSFTTLAHTADPLWPEGTPGTEVWTGLSCRTLKL
jgi:hypothetical protein